MKTTKVVGKFDSALFGNDLRAWMLFSITWMWGYLSRLQAAIWRHALNFSPHIKYLSMDWELYLWSAGESDGEKSIVSQSPHAVLSVYKYKVPI